MALNVKAITALVLRVLCLIFLLTSLIVLAADSNTDHALRVKIGFKDFNSYQYMMSTVVIGLANTLLQIPSSGKRLVDHHGLVLFEFYGDKVISSLLAKGVGAGFGATSDIKHVMDTSFAHLSLDDYLSKVDNFLNLANLSASFLLMAFFCIGASSVISSSSSPSSSALPLPLPNKQNK